MLIHGALSCLLATLLSASHVSADAIHDTKPTPTLDAEAQMVTPNEALQDYLENGNDLDHHLELRQATEYNLAATTAPTQAPAVTTFYMNQQVGTTVTWAPIVYTQLFADVPEQWPLAGVGEIGYGTLTKHGKREAAPTPAGVTPLPSGQPLVLELHVVGVTQWIQPVTQVTHLVVSTIVQTISAPISSTSNATIANMSMASATETGS